jgi:hypothetical protein
MAKLANILKWNILQSTFVVFSVVTALALVFVPIAYAAQITNRSVIIANPAASASTSYVFNFTVPSATVIQSASFTACTTASGACTTPAGFSASSSSLTAQPVNLGDAAGWTVDTSSAGALRLKKTGNTAAPTASQTVSFSGVVNPSATNATFFIRIATFSGDDWSTGAIDTGTVATSTAGQVTITAAVDETLTFSLANQTVPLGILTTSTTGSGTSTMSAATNASSGYSITVSGSTLTSGANTITALASPTASSVNNKQFGINLVANTTPAVGSNVSGSGSATAAAGYNTADLFKFVSGDTVASASAPTNSNTFTTSYIANIDGVTPPGSYQTVLTYVATANF